MRIMNFTLNSFLFVIHSTFFCFFSCDMISAGSISVVEGRPKTETKREQSKRLAKERQEAALRKTLEAETKNTEQIALDAQRKAEQIELVAQKAREQAAREQAQAQEEAKVKAEQEAEQERKQKEQFFLKQKERSERAEKIGLKDKVSEDLGSLSKVDPEFNLRMKQLSDQVNEKARNIKADLARSIAQAHGDQEQIAIYQKNADQLLAKNIEGYQKGMEATKAEFAAKIESPGMAPKQKPNVVPPEVAIDRIKQEILKSGEEGASRLMDKTLKKLADSGATQSEIDETKRELAWYQERALRNIADDQRVEQIQKGEALIPKYLVGDHPEFKKQYEQQEQSISKMVDAITRTGSDQIRREQEEARGIKIDDATYAKFLAEAQKRAKAQIAFEDEGKPVQVAQKERAEQQKVARAQEEQKTIDYLKNKVEDKKSYYEKMRELQTGQDMTDRERLIREFQYEIERLGTDKPLKSMLEMQPSSEQPKKSWASSIAQAAEDLQKAAERKIATEFILTPAAAKAYNMYEDYKSSKKPAEERAKAQKELQDIMDEAAARAQQSFASKTPAAQAEQKRKQAQALREYKEFEQEISSGKNPEVALLQYQAKVMDEKIENTPYPVYVQQKIDRAKQDTQDKLKLNREIEEEQDEAVKKAKIAERDELLADERGRAVSRIEQLLAPENTLYAVLNIAQDADASNIRGSMKMAYAQIDDWKKLIAMSNPEDAAHIADLVKQFESAVSKAYETLSDPKKRVEYNTQLARGSKLTEKGSTAVMPEIRDAELKRLAYGMKDNFLAAGSINVSQLKQINFSNIFLSKILSFIPQVDVEVFKDLIIRSPTFVDAPLLERGEKYGFAVIGSIIYRGAESKIKVVFVRTVTDSVGISVAITLPESWKFSEHYPALAKMDELSLLSGQLIASNFDYNDPVLGYVRTGLNFIARLNLTGPMEKFQEVLSGWGQGIFVKGGGVLLSGAIAPNPAKSSFTFTLPLSIGVDFEDLYKRGKLSSRPKIFSSIMTDAWKVIIAPKEILAALQSGHPHASRIKTPDVGLGNIGISVQSGIVLGLVGQKDPLALDALIGYLPPASWTFAGELRGTWDPAFNQPWLSLGDMAVEIDVDFEAMAAAALVGIPLPITGIGVQGTFGFGALANRVLTTIAGKVALKAPSSISEPLPIPEFILKGAVSKIDFTSFVQLLGKMVGKEIVFKDLPPIQVSDVELMVAPTGGTIGSTIYPQGVVAKGSMQLGKFAGSLDIAISNAAKSIHASGSMTGIKMPFFSLTGKEGTNPSFSLDLSPLKYEAFIDGQLGIPFLGISRGVTFSLDGRGLFAKMGVTSFFNTRTKSFEIRIPFTSFDDLLISYEIESSLVQSIKAAVQGKLEEWRSSIVGGMQNKRKELQKLITAQEDEIRRMSKQKSDAEEACSQKWKHFDPFSKDFWTKTPCVEATIKNLETAIGKLNISVKGLRSKLSETFEVVPDFALKGLSSAADLATVLEITRIGGRVSGRDLKEGKTPGVTIDLRVHLFDRDETRTLDNVQFDFKDPIKSAKTIYKAVIEFLK